MLDGRRRGVKVGMLCFCPKPSGVPEGLESWDVRFSTFCWAPTSPARLGMLVVGVWAVSKGLVSWGRTTGEEICLPVTGSLNVAERVTWGLASVGCERKRKSQLAFCSAEQCVA